MNALIRAHCHLLAAHIAVAAAADVPDLSGELERLRALAWQRLTDSPRPSEPEADTYLTVPQVAARLHLSRSFVYELTRRGEIPSHQLGRGQRGRRIKLAELVVWEATRSKDSS